MGDTRSRAQDGRVGAAWLALGPFFLFALAFEVVPVLTLLRSSLVVDAGLGLGNFRRALTPVMITSFRNSLQISLTTALLGVVLGTVVAYALVTTRSATIRHALTALADVTTNFGGAPLAFAFIVTLGSTGFVTLLLQKVGLDLTHGSASIRIRPAVAPLFPAPADDPADHARAAGTRADWREAATSLGATRAQFWLRVGLPILAPSLLGSFLLLANAFGAYATAWTPTGPDVNLVTVQIAALVRGEVQFDPALADALRPPVARGDGVCGRLPVAVATSPAVGDMSRPGPWRSVVLVTFIVHDCPALRDGTVLRVDPVGPHALAGGVHHGVVGAGDGAIGVPGDAGEFAGGRTRLGRGVGAAGDAGRVLGAIACAARGRGSSCSPSCRSDYPALCSR